MVFGERRSGIDTRSEAQKQLIGERRAGNESRTDMPSAEQLSLFARRLKRALRDEKCRSLFGVANGEHDFALYPDVIRVAEWIDRLSRAGQQNEEHAKPSLRRTAVAEPAATTDTPV